MANTRQLLGKRIKELRKGKGFSQDQLAERIDIDPKHLSRIEVGGSYPSMNTLERLGRVLEVEVKEFFEFTHMAETPKELKQTINRLTRKATKDQLKVSVKVLRAILK